MINAILLFLMLTVCSCTTVVKPDIEKEIDCDGCLDDILPILKEEEKFKPAEEKTVAEKPAVKTIEYFTFASDADIVLKQNLSEIAKKYNGNIMLGGDGSYPNVSDEFISVMKKADSLKAKKHVYLEGPGGPTGSSGIAGDECQRMLARAKKVGISIDKNNCSSSNAWIKIWNKYGWWKSLVAEVKYFNLNYGATSIEVEFLKRYQAEKLPATIMLKNLTVDDLKVLEKDIKSNSSDKLLRSSLTDFMISEEDFSGEWNAISEASMKIGIKMLKSKDTNNYKASGSYK